MNELLRTVYGRLPVWADSWLEVLAVALQVAAIALVAWAIMRITRRVILRVAGTYALPSQVTLVSRRIIGFLVYGTALLWSLERMGFSATVLWTAFTGFATVGAVAFFAAWSVLSNLFCALLIFTTRAFRIGDLVELVESGDKPGLKGRVLDINLVYTTLREEHGEGAGTTLQLPNSLFFQRALRRWPDGAAVSRTLVP
ncbi:MAG: mechanosensitive ion channel family protein [Lautropia sp.]